MNHRQLDREVSKIVLGEINKSFHPSRDESDAWRVVDWMYQKRLPVNFRNIHPVKVCHEVLRLSKESIAS